MADKPEGELRGYPPKLYINLKPVKACPVCGGDVFVMVDMEYGPIKQTVIYCRDCYNQMGHLTI